MMLKANKRPFFFVCGFRCTHVLTAFFCCFWFHNPKKKGDAEKETPETSERQTELVFFFFWKVAT